MLKFTPDGKVDRHNMMIRYSWADMADALDECVAALREISDAAPAYQADAAAIAERVLRKIGAEPK